MNHIDIVDIRDRQKNHEMCHHILARLEKGLTAVSVMYDEFSADLKSKENIYTLKQNIDYRLSSALKHHALLLEEHYKAEAFLAEQTKDDPLKLQRVIYGNPFFEIVEKDISAIFDSVIFNIASSFDYLSHIICYICKTNKTETYYWSKLANTSRGDNNEISKSLVKNQIDVNDREFVSGLYDYRSRLIHNKRDSHEFKTEQTANGCQHKIRLLMSSASQKHFKRINLDYNGDRRFTISYLSFWLIKQTAERFENILDSLVNEINDKSNYYNNLRGKKFESRPIMMFVDPHDNTGHPVSKKLWEDFKKMKILPSNEQSPDLE